MMLKQLVGIFLLFSIGLAQTKRGKLYFPNYHGQKTVKAVF